MPGPAGSGAEAGAALDAGAGQGAGGNSGGARAAEGGAPSLGAAGSIEGGAGPTPIGGADSQATCDAPIQRALLLLGDTWIESDKSTSGHGNAPSLAVEAGPTGGGAESRALLEFNLPAAPPGAVLVRGVLSLHLESNADMTLAERTLAVHVLAREVSETRTTWENYAQGGQGKWTTFGGDFGPEVAKATIPALSSEGSVSFDLTAALAEAFSPEPVPFPLIVLEAGPGPGGAAELAFTSSEGDASDWPSLIIEYCPP